MAATALAALGAAGCGGQTQAADEPSGTYTVAVSKAAFPPRQHLAQSTQMVINVRNTGRKPIPDVAVTLETEGSGTTAKAFERYDPQVNLADHSRPIWALDQGPYGGDTAYANTWALGSLAPGATKSFTWNVTAVKAGRYTIDYTVSAGLDGKAKARVAGGGQPYGKFPVRISSRPRQTRVSGQGRVIQPKGQGGSGYQPSYGGK